MLIPLPEQFVEYIQNDSDFGQRLLEALDQPSPISIRINPRKQDAKDCKDLRPVAWCEWGFYLPERPVFTLDPHYHAGVYYAQEAASMVIYSLVRQLELPKESFVLDLCAAPGGKTTAILDALGPEAAVLANEINRHRSNILAENISKWGRSNVAVSNNDPAIFNSLRSVFDLVLVDAPCSGEGMFRKDVNARAEWNENSPELCASRQSDILVSIIDSIKPGGYLVYSTCTFNRHENESQIENLLNQGDFEPVTWQHPAACIKGRNGLGIYFLPGYTDSEGLFLAVLRKKGERFENSIGQKRSEPCLLPFNLNYPTWAQFIVDKEKVRLTNSALHSLINQLNIPLRLLKVGTLVAESKPKGWEPCFEAVLCSELETDLPRIHVSEKQALQFLRGETFLTEPNQIGFYIIEYQHISLGLVKHLGNRFNNLYPKEWRIRMHID